MKNIFIGVILTRMKGIIHMIKPNLDRFSQPGPYERRRGVKSLLEIATCEVCEQDMHPSFLRSWNEREVCRFCIEELEEEYEREITTSSSPAT